MSKVNAALVGRDTALVLACKHRLVVVETAELHGGRHMPKSLALVLKRLSTNTFKRHYRPKSWRH